MTQSDKPLMVSALIVKRINDDGDVEILNVKAFNKEKYGFPGGKIEEGETPEQAVIRETIEELGVRPEEVALIGDYSSLTPEGRKINMYVFTGEITEQVSPMAEIEELIWLTYEQMTSKVHFMTPMTIEHVMPLLNNLALKTD